MTMNTCGINIGPDCENIIHMYIGDVIKELNKVNKIRRLNVFYTYNTSERGISYLSYLRIYNKKLGTYRLIFNKRLKKNYIVLELKNKKVYMFYYPNLPQ